MTIDLRSVDLYDMLSLAIVQRLSDGCDNDMWIIVDRPDEEYLIIRHREDEVEEFLVRLRMDFTYERGGSDHLLIDDYEAVPVRIKTIMVPQTVYEPIDITDDLPDFAIPGDKMLFMGKNGRDDEQEKARATFAEGQVLTVSDVEIGGWSSGYVFEGVKGWWNTVMFEFAEPEKVATESKIEREARHAALNARSDEKYFGSRF